MLLLLLWGGFEEDGMFDADGGGAGRCNSTWDVSFLSEHLGISLTSDSILHRMLFRQMFGTWHVAVPWKKLKSPR